MRYLFFLLFCFALSGYSSAITPSEGQKVNTAPKITLIAPAEDDILQIGKAIHFDMDLDDDNQLKSYRVEIHENFDGHAHTKENEGSVFPSVFDKTWEITGKGRNVHHHGIVIPANAKEGIYHFVIYCTNVAGEQSTVIRTVHLSSKAGTQYHH